MVSMDLVIRPVVADDLPEISALVEAAFAVGIAPRVSEEGCRAFRSFAAAGTIRARLSGESEGWVGVGADGVFLGYVEMTGDHLRMLFTRPVIQGRGVGGRLFDHALDRRGGRGITVNSAPNSDGFYLRMGFRPTGPQTEKHGIVFTPMERPNSRGGKFRGHGRTK